VRQKSFFEFQITAHEAGTTPIRTYDAGVKVAKYHSKKEQHETKFCPCVAEMGILARRGLYFYKTTWFNMA
jgi:hypothetical protein